MSIWDEPILFCRNNLKECCKELIAMQDEGTLIQNKVRELANLLTFIPTDNRLYLAIKIVHDEAMKKVLEDNETTNHRPLITVNDELKAAFQVLLDEGLDDSFIYRVRDKEMEGWDGPRVTATSNAIKVIKEAMNGPECSP